MKTWSTKEKDKGQRTKDKGGKMKQEIFLNSVEEKRASTGAMFSSFKTDHGTINVFDAIMAKTLADNLGKIVEVETEQNGKYLNIKEFLGSKEGKPKELDDGYKLKRIMDCIIEANQTFIQGKINKDEIATHAKSLHNLIGEIDVSRVQTE